MSLLSDTDGTHLVPRTMTRFQISAALVVTLILEHVSELILINALSVGLRRINLIIRYQFLKSVICASVPNI